MLKELFESSFYITYPLKPNVVLNLVEHNFNGPCHLVDIKACRDCREICDANPQNREQFKFYAGHTVHVLRFDDVLQYAVGNFKDNCDFIMDDGNKICLIEMTCSSQKYIASKRSKCRDQFWNTITLLRSCYAIRRHIDSEKQYVIFSWKETFPNMDSTDAIEVTMKGMTMMTDDVYSPDNESNFDNSFKYKEIRYPYTYAW